jgi:hypothetical protein
MLPTTSFIAEAAHQSFVQASNLGLGDKFIASLLEAQEKLNNVRSFPAELDPNNRGDKPCDKSTKNKTTRYKTTKLPPATSRAAPAQGRA